MPATSSRAQSDQGGGFNSIYIGVSQKKAFTATSGQSAAVGAGTSIIRVTATQDCHIVTGLSPTAVADGTCLFLKSGVIEYVGIEPGHKVAVIRDSADGNLFISEGA